MPVSCKKINGKYRIVGSNGTVEKTTKGNSLDGGGHSTKSGCTAQARAINASIQNMGEANEGEVCCCSADDLGRAVPQVGDTRSDLGVEEAGSNNRRAIPAQGKTTANQTKTKNGKSKDPRTKVVPSNPLKADPTRTQTLRRRFLAEVHKRFRRLKGKILELVIEQDAFGIKPKGPFDFKVFNADNPELAINDVEDQLSRFATERWRFRTNPQKLEAFQLWLKQQIDQGILDVDSADPDKWWNEFVERGYRQGAGRAFDDSRKPALSLDDQGRVSDFYRGTKNEFLRASFARPESVEKVKLLTGRVFTDLQGVTKAMETSMVWVLADGLVRGENPRTIARSLNKEVDGIGKRRAEMIARSEVIRAHSEGQLDSLEQLGVTEVGVAVEWSTAGDGRVCPRCAPLQGTIHPIKKAHGLIPRHPNCRCAFLPANVGEPKQDQLRTKTRIEKAIRRSLKAEGGKQKSRWVGADLKPTKAPKSVLDE